MWQIPTSYEFIKFGFQKEASGERVLLLGLFKRQLRYFILHA